MPKGFRPKDKPLPVEFRPLFWHDQDQRYGIAREVQRRVRTLCQDAGVDSEQKRLIAQRVVFLGLRLETMEVEAARSGKIDLGVYSQSVNCLLGLLKSLGLDRVPREQIDLKTYVQVKDNGGGG